MKPDVIAENNYYRFCNMEGSEYIASEFALKCILKLLEKFKVTSILELGVGIGAIADTVLQYAAVHNKTLSYFGTENNKYCRSVIVKNIQNISGLTLYSELLEVPKNKKFDLIIIDGQDNQLSVIKRHCKKGTIIFIEGDRSPQRDIILDLFPESLYVNMISLEKNKPYAHGLCGTEHYVGGGQLIFTKPNLKSKIFWVQQKAKTALYRRIRKLK